MALLALVGRAAGDTGMIRLAASGVADYMRQYPRLRVEHSQTADLAKLLMAAAAIYRATSDPRHLEYLKTLVGFLAEIQDETGGIPERDLHQRRARFVRRNEQYGQMEASVYVDNANRITDQLYSSGFVAIALHMALKTGGAPNAGPVLERLLDYLVTIQVESSNPQTDGAWLRAYDMGLHEYFGSNGDAGWGAYCIETGWMVALNMIALAWHLTDFDPFEAPAREVGLPAIYATEQAEHARVEQVWKRTTPLPPKAFKPGTVADPEAN
jgi:hypothetical protein